MWLNLANAIDELRRTFAGAFDTYRPELHYMRGPGPKCRAKRAGTVSTAAPVAVDGRALHGMANARA
jgi:hypothetical protein